jgi:hypothetical protein
MNMAKNRHNASEHVAATENLGDESVTYQETEAASSPRVKRTRTKIDVSALDPLDQRVYRLQRAHRVIKIARELDTETLTVVFEELTKLQAKAAETKAAE